MYLYIQLSIVMTTKHQSNVFDMTSYTIIDTYDKNKQIKDQFIVSYEDGFWIRSFKWSIYDRYPRHSKLGTISRFLLGVDDPDKVVDHINGDTRDNRRSNLHISSFSQNSHNKVTENTKAGRYRGVTKRGEYWRVRAGGQNFGQYNDAIVAARIYNIAAKQLYGDFAILNDVDEDSNLRLPDKKPHARNKERGVQYDKNRRSWLVKFRINGKIKYFGSFKTQQEATEVALDIKSKHDPHHLKEIKRDSEGIAIIPIKHKDQTLYARVDDDKWFEFTKSKWYLVQNYAIANINHSSVTMHTLVCG